MSDSDALTITCSFLTSGQNLLKQDFICGDNVLLLHLSVALCTGVLLVLQYVEFTPSQDLLYFLSVFHSHFFSLFKKLANNVTKWYFRLPVFFVWVGVVLLIDSLHHLKPKETSFLTSCLHTSFLLLSYNLQ